MIGRIPRQSFPIRKVWAEIEQAWSDVFWSFLDKNRIEFLRYLLEIDDIPD